MKTSFVFPLLACLFMLASPGYPAGKADKKTEKSSDPKPSEASAAGPSDKLASFLTKNLEQMLGLLQTGAEVSKKQPPDNRRLSASRGHSSQVADSHLKLQADVMEMTEAFKKASLYLPEPEQAPYARALELCSQFTLILNDRQTRFERFLNSRAAQTPTVVESRETKADPKQDRREAFEHKSRVSERIEQEWLKVSTEYRQIVSNMLDRVRLAEKAVRDAKASPKP
jgi:hypothetical protein